ncbi:F-box only protein 43 isoform X2 [Ambystoma mexicanum]|uniref:F-box only protein 43 isoform X2 n=1 Tax=Ambystoma mexicanum TaxID=8296 RepID=UPI0037E860C2
MDKSKISKGTQPKMSDSCSVEPYIPTRDMESPSINRKINYNDTSSTSLSLDSGFSESLCTTSFDISDAQETNISLHHKHSDSVDPHSKLTILSPIKPVKWSSLTFDRKEAKENSAVLCETPKVTNKNVCLRRRLLMSKTSSNVSFEYFDTPGELNCRNRNKKPSCHVPDIKQSLLNSFDDSSIDIEYKPIATSTLKTEEPVVCQKRRLAFAQQRTSTVDDSKSDLRLIAECKSAVQLNIHGDDTDLDSQRFNDVISDGNIMKTPEYSKLSETIDEEFLTPIGNLAAHFNFSLSNFNSPPVVKEINLDDSSTREDSAFSSLSLDKSQDSTDQDDSFQELQKQNETPRGLYTKSRQRTLERSKRLSTLSECGSQSEAEDNSEIEHINLQYKLSEIRDSVNEELELCLSEKDHDGSVLKIDDLLGTPALRIVHEMLVRSKRKRPEETTVQDLLVHTEGAEMSTSETILTRLIGRKMGLEKVDILKELKCRNLKHVLAIILDAINVESICSIWKVSRNWQDIVLQDKRANRRRKLYMKELKAETERGHLLSVEDAATRLQLLNRSALKSVQPQAKSVFQTPTFCKGILTPTNCSPSPWSCSKQEEYVKVAKTLFADEALKPCPRCQFPAKYQPMKKRGICSRQDCAFDFCILCLCSFHGSKDCSSSSVKRLNGKDALPGSAQSKRNLRRL